MQNNTFQSSEANLHAIDYLQVVKNRYGIILITFILSTLVALVVASVKAKKYESTAVIQVKPNGVDMDAHRASSANFIQSQQFFETEYEVIKSEKTLSLAAKIGKFESLWNQPIEDIVEIFSQAIEVRNTRGTHLVEITMTYTDAGDAKLMADAVCKAYDQRRKALGDARYDKAKSRYKARLREASDHVEELRKKKANLAKAIGEPEGGANFRSAEEEAYRRLSEEVMQLDTELKTLTLSVERLNDLNDEQLIPSVIALELRGESELVSLRNEQLSGLLVTKKSHLASGLGAKHPEVAMVESSITELQNDLAVRCKEVRKSLQNRLINLTELYNEQKEKLAASSVDRLDAARSQAELDTAKQEYFDAHKILMDMQNVQIEEDTTYILRSEPLEVHEEPKKAKSHSSPRVEIYMGVGALFGLLMGVGIAFGLELMDTSVKSLEDVERFLKVPVLAVIPQDVGVLHKQSGASPDAEAYRILRTNIEFNRKNPDDNCITVVSGGAGEGKSTTMVNLAYICAQGGYSTLMIDADLRRPRMHTFFDINNSVGLTNYLTTDLVLEDVILQTPVDNLFFMPSGILPADAAGILNSRRMSELIQDVKQRFDLVLIDSPPILGVSDASVLASEVDLTMIVVQHRKLPREMLVRVKDAVENVGGHVLGVVLNNVDVRSDNQYQYYTSYYTYYSPTSAPVSASQAVQARDLGSKEKEKTASASASKNEDLF